MEARELRVEDLERVCRLRARHGFSVPDEGQWVNLHLENPARRERSEAPLGWVLERHGEIVGCFLNIPQRWWFAGKPLAVAATSGWIVDEEARHSSLQLVSRYFSQRGVDLLVNWSANPISSRLFEAFRGKRVPSDGNATILTWVTRPSSACAEYLKGRVPGLVRSVAVGVARGWERVQPRRATLTNGLSVVDAIDERFDDLWIRLREAGRRCTQVRDGATLRWILEGRRSGWRVLASERDGALAGYIALVRWDHRGSGLSRYRVVDLQAMNDDATLVTDLMAGALSLAAEEGVSLCEVVGFHEGKRAVLRRLSPIRRKRGGWPFYYRAAGDLQGDLHSASSWDPCSIEGDGVVGSF